jgi:hypothetical protein
MFAKVLAVLSVGSALFLLPREPARPAQQAGDFTLSRVVLQNCEVDIRPKGQRPMPVTADYEEVINDESKHYEVSFVIGVPTDDKVYVAGYDADEANSIKFKKAGKNKVTLDWDYNASPAALELTFTDGTATKSIDQDYEGEFDRFDPTLKVSTQEIRRLDADTAKRRVRVFVESCGTKTAFTLSDV